VDAVSPSYKGYRYPAEVIAHCVWLYHRFPLSFREVEELMLARGAIVSNETIRQWCAKFGPTYARALRRRRPRAGDKWHLDEVFVKINGERRCLWRAAGQDGNVLDILVQSRRDAKAAKRFLRKLMNKQCRTPRVLVTDKLRSYGVAHREMIRSVEHRRSKYLNNRAENSHQPTRQRERAMKGFRSPGGAQQFLSVFSAISPHFRPRRHRLTAPRYRDQMDRPLHHLARDHRLARRGLTAAPAPARPSPGTPSHSQTPDKLTTPRRQLSEAIRFSSRSRQPVPPRGH
jgi:putative transposase